MGHIIKVTMGQCQSWCADKNEHKHKETLSPKGSVSVINFLAILSQNSVSGPINLVIPSLSTKTQSYEVKTEYTSRAYYLSSKVNRVIHSLSRHQVDKKNTPLLATSVHR